MDSVDKTADQGVSFFKPHKYEDAPPTAVPIVYQAATTPLAAPYTAPLASTDAPTSVGFCCFTAKLMVFHVLNFVLGTVGFAVEVTGVSLAAGLLPLCLLGIPIYFGTLHITRVMTLADIALANMITPSNMTVRLDVPDTEGEDDAIYPNDLRIAPNLTRISVRSSVAVVYFATAKFALAIASAVVVALPFLPIVSQIIASSTSKDTKEYTAGWEVHSFNFSTNPVAYAFVCIGYIVGGLLLIHVFGIASRETTRFVCCIKTTRRVATV